MRLMKDEGHGNFSLVEQDDDNETRYAILSHTWGADGEEITFKDLLEGTGKNKAGYKKIEFCRQQAANDGLQYFWVDTCCIDKSSSAELTEAINSMFRWYQNAFKCYVYLSDVSISKHATNTPLSPTTWEAAFRESRWFTRGWTLQELIAPRSVEFFSREGDQLGSKESLEQYIHEITGIAIGALKGAPLTEFKVEKRMSWAKFRETKRPEDKAYSLLGIFNIYMPLLYGEGRENAFVRLWKEIANSSAREWDFYAATTPYTQPSEAASAITRRLPIAVGAAFDSHQDELNERCHPATRIELLKDIYNWAQDPDGKCIFWLSGMAGTGKSTISRTVAKVLADQGRLGASFFFKRGDHDRENASLFFTTIAHDLVNRIPEMLPRVHKAINDEPGVALKSLKVQFEKLISEPLIDVNNTRPASSIVLVIDALDECEREGDVRTILSLLASTRQLRSVRMRIFLTSRPELSIRLGVARIGAEAHLDVVLHQILPSTIYSDIKVYLEDKFTQIRDEHNCVWPADQSLAPDWPGLVALQTLAQLAMPLFIVAATICRFVGDPRGDPAERLATVLRHQNTGQMSQMERTYLPVVSQLSIGLEEADEKDNLWRDFREIVGSIILLANPLSIASLSRLLNTTKRKVEHQLRLLHSVLCIPPDPNGSIQLLHLSFREYLVQRQHGRQEPFKIDGVYTHQRLVEKCLSLLHSPDGLRKDICHLGHPGVQREDVDQSLVDLYIPPHLKYACLYWVDHVQHSGRRIRDGDNIDGFLQQHFLHWLEALSLIGKTAESVHFMNTLQSLVAEKNSQVSIFLHDAWRFVLTFNRIIAQTPLQAYGSAWHFSPLQSIVKSTFQDQALQAVRVSSGIPEQWNACLLIYEGHSESVLCVVFSPDGTRVASGSYDGTVQVWDVQTSECQRTLKGHSGGVSSVVFSPDGNRVVSLGFYDTIVRVWDVETGECEHTLNGHSCWVRSVAFSFHGSRVASGSDDSTVRVWDVHTGICQYLLKGHSDRVSSVVFSPDNSRLASGSYDCTVRIWDVQTGEFQFTLRGHSNSVSCVVFSPDNSRLASGSYDSTVRIWDVQTGECQHRLTSHCISNRGVFFSLDGSQVLSSSMDGLVQIWDVHTGESQHQFEILSSPPSGVMFSPDGSRIVSALYDGTVQVWDARTGELQNTLQGHSDSVNSVVFSPDGSRIASSSSDKTARVWEVQKSQRLHAPEDHLDSGKTIMFSLDGSRIASSSVLGRHMVQTWDVQNAEYQDTPERYSDLLNSVVLSPDGLLVASILHDKMVRVWDINTAKLLLCHSTGIYKNEIAFSDDSTKIVANGELIFIPSLYQTSSSISRRSSMPVMDFVLDEQEIANDWVIWSSKKVLWLPPNYRPGRWLRQSNIVFIDGGVNRVIFVYRVRSGFSF